MGLNTLADPKDCIISADLQAREGLDFEHVADIVQAILRREKLPRTRVMLIEDESDKAHHGKLYAIDQHRTEAFRRAEKQMPIVRLTGTWQDARDLAMSANVEHKALKRDHAAIRRAIVMALTDHPDWTDNRIAKHVQAHPSRVTDLRPTVKVARETTERVGLDGKKRDHAKAGRPAASEKAAEGAEPGTPKAGKKALTFDWRAFDTHYGWLVRSIGALHSLSPDPGARDAALEGLNSAVKAFNVFRSKLEKKG